MKMTTEFTPAMQFQTKQAAGYTEELKRVQAKGFKMPSLTLKKIPYELIIIDSAAAQVRADNSSEFKMLTDNIYADGLESPPVFQPYNEIGKYVPVTGHTRVKSCRYLNDQLPHIASKHDLLGGIWAYVYDEALPEDIFDRVGLILNNHRPANTNTPSDIRKYVEARLADGRVKLDLDSIVEAIEDIGISSSRAQNIKIAKALIKAYATKDVNEHIKGAVVTYKTGKDNLFKNFEVVTNEKVSKHHNKETKTFSVVNGLSMDPSWKNMLGQDFNSLMDAVRISGGSVNATQRDLYLHIIAFDASAKSNGESPEEMLLNARTKILKEVEWRAGTCDSSLMPTRIIFFPQLQRETTQAGKPVMGEEIKDLIWSLSKNEKGEGVVTKV